MSAYESLKKAIELAGGQTALARKVSNLSGENVKQQHVYNWLHRQKQCSRSFARYVEKAVNNAVTKEDLCPELYLPVSDKHITAKHKL